MRYFNFINNFYCIRRSLCNLLLRYFATTFKEAETDKAKKNCLQSQTASIRPIYFLLTFDLFDCQNCVVAFFILQYVHSSI